MGSGAHGFVLLAVEDIKSSNGGLGVTVLTSLGGGEIDNLAGSVVDDNESTLTDLTSLLGLSIGSTGINVTEFFVGGHFIYIFYLNVQNKIYFVNWIEILTIHESL